MPRQSSSILPSSFTLKPRRIVDDAQEPFRDRDRNVARGMPTRHAQRKATVGANMNLTEAEAAKFWPVYDAYEAKMDKLEARHVKELKDFADKYENLSDADAGKKLEEVIAIQQGRLDIQKEFVPK